MQGCRPEVTMPKARFVSALLVTLSLAAPASAASKIAGAWRPDLYTLKDGSEQAVTGLIFFTERDWTVLFFEVGDKGAPERGSGEGGTYSLEGDRLVFTHLFHLSGGSTPLEMSVKKPGEAETEPCRVEVEGETMTIHFPSGNRMRFQRSSGG
jgi:hypothetical protein